MRELRRRSKGMVKRVKVFEIKVGVHQGSVLSPLLFNIVMQAIADNFKKGLPWELLYADDLLLLADSRLELEKRLTEWMARLKEKGLRVNIGKAKVMNCKSEHRSGEELG